MQSMDQIFQTHLQNRRYCNQSFSQTCIHLFLIQTISYQIQSKHSNNLFTLVIKHQKGAQLGETFQMGG